MQLPRPSRIHVRPLALLVALVALAGCAPGDEAATTTGDEARQDTTGQAKPAGGDDGDGTGAREDARDILGDAQTCTNDEDGYRVSYPEDWHTNSGRVTTSCQYFAPEPIELRPGTEPTGVAIAFRVEPIAYERMASEVVGGRGEELTSRGETTVAGRDALVVDARSTGGALLPEGTRSHRYVVDLGERTMIASTDDTGDASLDERRRILEAMVETLELQ